MRMARVQLHPGDLAVSNVGRVQFKYEYHKFRLNVHAQQFP
jgi:hypothetical protein